MNGSKTNPITFSYGALTFTEPSDEASIPTGSSGPENSSEETIDLSAMFAVDVSSSGSFDLRRARLSPFTKLLQALPIPTLLVDKAYMIVFANRACKRATGKPGTTDGQRFSDLFPNQADGERAEELIQKVFHNRIPLIAEGMLGSDQIRMLGRIHFRSVRVQKMRMMLVIIEDISPSEPFSRETSGPLI